jgi:hypothetical protein
MQVIENNVIGGKNCGNRPPVKIEEFMKGSNDLLYQPVP